MRSFMEHVPEHSQRALRKAIEAVTETKVLLDQVKARFGTCDPGELEQRMHEVFDGIEVTPRAVAELKSLHDLHEERRAACRSLMERIARGEDG
jgi:hypothetical protein